MIRCMPVLQVANVERSERFYCEKLVKWSYIVGQFGSEVKVYSVV